MCHLTSSTFLDCFDAKIKSSRNFINSPPLRGVARYGHERLGCSELGFRSANGKPRLGPWPDGPLISGSSEQSELNPEFWGLLAKSFSIILCTRPQPPPLKNNAGEKCLFGNFICMENIFFFVSKSSSLCRVFHLLSAKTICHYLPHPKSLLRNWMLLPKMGIFSFPFAHFSIHNIPQTPENKIIESKHISFKHFPWEWFCCG